MLREAVSRGAARAVPQHSGVLRSRRTLPCSGAGVPFSGLCGCACSSGHAQRVLALPARFSAGWNILRARLWGWGQCPVELVRGGIMPSAAAGNQPPAGAARLPGHQAGTAPAKVTSGLSPGHAPGSQGSLLCNGGHF